MLSPVPLCVYLSLPAELLREQEIDRGGERESKKAQPDTGKKRKKQERRNESCLHCK